MSDRIEFTDIYVDDEIVAAVEDVVRSTRYVKGPVLESFESAFADLVGTEHAVGVSSGTAALLLAMDAADIGAGDQVIVPAHSYFATVSPVLKLGAEPIFVNVTPDSFCLDVDELAAAAEAADNPQAVVPVHLYGHPAPMDAVADVAAEHDLTIIEDCAQAHGATLDGRSVGSFGDAGCFSFYPSKNMTVGGDGGMITTDDGDIARAARELRNHGRNEAGEHVRLGLNYRLDEVNAAVGREQLDYVVEWGDQRRRWAHRYTDQLQSVDAVTPPSEVGPVEHVYHLYVVRVPERNALRAHLDDNGVDTGIHYEKPLHRQPAVEARVEEVDGLERTERLCDEIVSLPMHPRMDAAEVDEVCRLVRAFYEGGAE
jgi:dTDP-4-amino-4,6-dideoxygalactose transaminase